MTRPTVVCVLRSGGDFTREWVWALRRGLRRHAPPHDFVCLTDVAGLGMWAEPLRHGWPGWWSKVECWRPGLVPDGAPVVYLDLDTLVVGDLSDLFAYRGRFAMLSDFYRTSRPASGVMLWRAGEGRHIYERFRENADAVLSARRRGRMDHWLERHVGEHDRVQDLVPGQVVSLKAHCDPRRTKGPPDGARLVCFHGRPRPNDPKAGWAHERWASVAVEPETTEAT